jgi:hypothetical protein
MEQTISQVARPLLLEGEGPSREEAGMADRDERDESRIDDGLQSGGTRGSSHQGGAERSVHAGEEPARNNALKVNRGDADGGSRSSLPESTDPTADEIEAADQPGRLGDAPRGPLPSGASRADYVGGEEPHKTVVGDRTPGASGGRNEVL